MGRPEYWPGPTIANTQLFGAKELSFDQALALLKMLQKGILETRAEIAAEVTYEGHAPESLRRRLDDLTTLMSWLEPEPNDERFGDYFIHIYKMWRDADAVL
jgi:hypothetical protein